MQARFLSPNHLVECKIRLEDFSSLGHSFRQNYLRETTFFTIGTECIGKDWSTIFRKFVCLNTFEGKVFSETEWIFTIFVWPPSKCRCHFFGEHFGGTSCNVYVSAIVAASSFTGCKKCKIITFNQQRTIQRGDLEIKVLPAWSLNELIIEWHQWHEKNKYIARGHINIQWFIIPVQWVQWDL